MRMHPMWTLYPFVPAPKGRPKRSWLFSSPMLSIVYACSTGSTHQTCLTVYRRVGDLRSIHRVPNLTDNGVLMVHRVWSDRFRCTKANQPNFRLRKKQIRWDWKKDSSFYKPRLKSISVVGNWRALLSEKFRQTFLDSIPHDRSDAFGMIPGRSWRRMHPDTSSSGLP